MPQHFTSSRRSSILRTGTTVLLGTLLAAAAAFTGRPALVEAATDTISERARSFLPFISRAPAAEVVGDTATGADPSFLPTALRLPHCCMADQIVSADLNGDGRGDLVLPSGYQLEVAVRLAVPGGGFDEPRAYPLPDLGLRRATAAVGDATGDGHVDIIVAVDNSTILVFPNDGGGGFGSPRELSSAPGGVYPYAVAFADADGDGDGDIVTANSDSDDVSILRGDGRGTFAAAIVVAAGDNPTTIAVSDVTGDGNPDILTGNAGSLDVTLLAGNGTGGFTAPAVVPIGANSNPLSIVIADVTGDGKPDVVTANQQSDGSPFPPPELAGSISVVSGDGDGRFAEPAQYQVPDGYGRIQDVAIGDVTGDGRADLVGTLPLKSRVVVFAAQDGQFADPIYRPAGGSPNVVTVIDATDDGNLDVVTANITAATLSILPGDGAGQIGYDGNFDVGAAPNSVVATDLNKDGRIDLATAELYSETVTVLMGSTDGRFAPAASRPSPGFPGKIAAGDLNRDGNQDLVVATMFFGEVSVLLGDGVGDFAPPLRTPVSNTFHGPYTFALGDVNKDGILDVVTANSAFVDHDDSLSLLIGKGDGRFAAPELLIITGDAARYDPKDVVLADANGDGNIDILTANFAGHTVSIFAGDGKGRFSKPAHLPTEQGPIAVRVADVSADGIVDLIVLNHTEQTVSVSKGTGSGRARGGPNRLQHQFSAAQHFALYDSHASVWLQPWPKDLIVRDVTGDGHADLVTANAVGDSISVLPNDGTGFFRRYFVYGTGGGPSAMAAARMDGDALIDIVTANSSTHNVSVLLNRSAVAAGAEFVRE